MTPCLYVLAKRPSKVVSFGYYSESVAVQHFYSPSPQQLPQFHDAAAKQMAVFCCLFFSSKSAGFINFTISFTKLVRSASAAMWSKSCIIRFCYGISNGVRIFLKYSLRSMLIAFKGGLIEGNISVKEVKSSYPWDFWSTSTSYIYIYI